MSKNRRPRTRNRKVKASVWYTFWWGILSLILILGAFGLMIWGIYLSDHPSIIWF